LNKTPINIHPLPKQNGSSQPNGTCVPKPLLPVKNEKPLTKELVSLPKHPKLKLNGFVGFAALPYQVVRRSQQRGYALSKK
jgi:hypothetical protein